VDFKKAFESDKVVSFLCTWHHPVGHFEGKTTGAGWSPRPSQPRLQPTHQRRQDQTNGQRRAAYSFRMNNGSRWIRSCTLGPWLQKMVSIRRNSVQVNRGQAIGESLQNLTTDFNEDTTNESASVACSDVRLWKLDTEKEVRNTSWRLWDERTEKDSAGFMDSKEKNEWILNKTGVVIEYGHSSSQSILPHSCENSHAI